uniref:Uncharacterized protein n=1 Tax=Petromyzon marinus TaxID=7757 RepID=S4RM84_PETMA
VFVCSRERVCVCVCVRWHLGTCSCRCVWECVGLCYTFSVRARVWLTMSVCACSLTCLKSCPCHSGNRRTCVNAYECVCLCGVRACSASVCDTLTRTHLDVCVPMRACECCPFCYCCCTCACVLWSYVTSAYICL